MSTNTQTDTVARAILTAVADHPGRLGCVGVARFILGREVTGVDSTPENTAPEGWTIRDAHMVAEALVDGGLLASGWEHATSGSRGRLVLTRAGHRALDALEAATQEETHPT